MVGFVEAPARGLDLPLDVRGTAFQQRVWQALREIPPGSTASYAEIAARIGAPKAVRAVAQACAANPIAVAIPCHRVVRTRRRAVGLPLGRRAQARAARARGRGMTAANLRRRPHAAERAPTADATRVAALDWPGIAAELDAHGCAVARRC